MLPLGYSDVPDGKLAAVVTCLEMREPPPPRPERASPDPAGTAWTLRQVADPDADWYRRLFGRIGADWLWYSRLLMPRTELEAVIGSPDVEVFALEVDGVEEGLLELDFREPDECELAFFGLTRMLQGRGAGRWLMNRALERAWGHPSGKRTARERRIRRLWVHTCTLDHPDALAFYLRCGFHAYARRVEVADDPRLTGLLPRTVAAHVPIIDPQPIGGDPTP